MERRHFIFKSLLASGGFMLLKNTAVAKESSEINEAPEKGTFPMVISTWAPNVKANAAAWDVLSKGEIGRAHV